MAASTGSSEQGLRKVGAKVGAVVAALAAGYLLALSPAQGIAQQMLDQEVGAGLHDLGSTAAELHDAGQGDQP